MAKIRIAQIKDLSLTTAENGVREIRIGTLTDGTANTITPLTKVATTFTADNNAESFLTGLTIDGNTIVPKHKTIASVLANLTGSATIATVADGVVTLKAGVSEANGIISNSTGTDITLAKVATTGAAADVTVTPDGNLTSTNVQDALAELQEDIDSINGQSISAAENQAVRVTTTDGDTIIGLQLATGEKVLSQSTAGLQTTLTVDTKKYPTESTAEGYVADKAGKTYIQIKGIDGEVISETDAAAFVKDGFLQSVTKDADTNELVFTWNTDAEAGEENQVTRIAISDLCDVYTAKVNDWIQLNGFEFSHKLSDVIEGEQTSKTVGSATITTDDNAVDNAGETVTFKVPTITVDRAGHVTSASEAEIAITLPEYIGTAVQTITGETAELNNSEYVNVKVVKTNEGVEGEVGYTLTSKVKVGSFPTTADGEVGQGLATVQDVKEYVENNASTTMFRQVLNGVSATNSTAQLTYIPVGDVAITQNGIDLDFGEYTVGGENGKTVTFNIDEDVDVETTDVFVAYYMYNPNTQPQQND